MVTSAGLKSNGSISTLTLAANAAGAKRIVTRLKTNAGANKFASLEDFIFGLSFITIHVSSEAQAGGSGEGMRFLAVRKRGRMQNEKSANARIAGIDDYH